MMKTVERIGIVLGGFALGLAIKHIKTLKWENECLQNENGYLRDELDECERFFSELSNEIGKTLTEEDMAEYREYCSNLNK